MAGFDWRRRRELIAPLIPPLAATGAVAALALAIAFWPVPERRPGDGVSLPPLKPTDIHAGLDYSLHAVAESKQAPRLIIRSLDADLGRIRDTDEKKRTFFRIMLPIVAAENDRIRAERRRIAAASDAELADLYRKYEVAAGDRAALLRRCDIVPASLALAQAAIESGWGASRFARHGNNFFGMRTYDKNQPGLAPKQATGFKVTVFKSIADGVRAYMFNLNTHLAYAAFRRERARQRTPDGHVSGFRLVDYLTSYSEIRDQYAARLRQLISRDRLQRFEGVRLKAKG